MDFESYKNTLPYPRSVEHDITYWYRGGKLVAKRIGDGPTLDPDGVELEIGKVAAALMNSVKERVIDDKALTAARQAYNAEAARLHQKFRDDLFVDLGITMHPLRDKLFAKAWEDGHSSGYSEVYNCALGLMDLIELPSKAVLITADDGFICGSSIRFSPHAMKIAKLADQIKELL